MSKQLNTMDCKEVQRKLPPYLDNQMAGQARDAVERHLGACPACRRELEQLQSDMSLLARTSVPEPSPYLTTRVMAEIRSRQAVRARVRTGLRHVFGSAVAVLVVSACVSIGAFLGSGLGRSRPGVTAASEELTVSVNEPNFADAFASVVAGE